MPSSRPKAYLSLLLVSIIWGMAGPVIKLTLHHLPPFTFLFWRFLISSFVLFFPLLKYLQKHPLGLKQILSLIILSLLSTTINLSLIFLGFERTSALDGTLLSSITPIFIVIAGAVFLQEKITRQEKLGLTIALLGTFITLIQPFLDYRPVSARQNFTGNLFILAAGLEWTLYLILAKKLARIFSPFLMMSSASFVALATFIPLAYVEMGAKIFNFQFLNLDALMGVIYMSIFSYILAYFLFQWGLSKIEASETAPFAYLQPVFAAPLAILWLNEKITWPFLIGAATIFIGVIIAESRKQKYK